MKKLGIVVLSLILWLSATFTVSAESVTEGGIKLSVTTDRKKYDSNERIKATITVKNKNDYTVKDVSLKCAVPDGYDPENATLLEVDSLEKGEELTIKVILVPKTGTAVKTAVTSGTAATGDRSSILLWSILLLLAIIGGALLWIKRKGNLLGLILCAVSVLTLVSLGRIDVQAAKNTKTVRAYRTVSVGTGEMIIEGKVTYTIPEGVELSGDTSKEPVKKSFWEQSVESVDEIYVSTDANAGEGDGSFNNPFSEIEEAQELIRKMKEQGKYPEDGVNVYFREGQYGVSETLTFTAEDSGEEGAPVIYRAYQNEKVAFVGGMDMQLTNFSKVTDQSVLARISADARDKIRMIDLKALGINDYGELNVYGAAAGYFGEAGIEIPQGYAPELFFNGEKMELSRYPNKNDGEDQWVTIGDVVNLGTVVQNWTSVAYAGEYVAPEDRDLSTVTCPTFKVDNATAQRMKGWTQADDLWVYGYWQMPWSDQSMPVSSFDTEQATITTGVPSGKKVTKGMYFYFYNLLEELDTAGEFYIDRTNGVLYFYPSQDNGEVTLSLLDEEMFEFAAGSHDIQIDGIEFKAGRTKAVRMREAERICITNCDMSKFAENAVTISECKDVTISGCHLYDLGEGGISTSNDTYSDAVLKLENSGIVIENCEIHHFSVNRETYSYAVSAGAVGTVVRNCKIYDGTHSAIGVGAADVLIENNEFYDVLKTVSDSGVIYTGFTKEQMGVVIRNNYVHDIYSPNASVSDIFFVYCDDTKDGVTIESNLIVNVAGAGTQINGGWDNNFRWNVIINSLDAARISAIGASNAERYSIQDSDQYKVFRYVNENNCEAYKKYPHWEGKLEALLKSNTPKYNFVGDNVIINCNGDLVVYDNLTYGVTKDNIRNDYNNTLTESYVYSLAEAGLKDIVDGAYTVEHGFVIPTNGDLTLSADSPIRQIEGFKPYDFLTIGLKNGEIENCGTLGRLGMKNPTEAELPEGYFLKEDFSGNLDEWKITNTWGGAYVFTTEDDQLQIDLTGESSATMMNYFAETSESAAKGIVVYETKYKVNPNQLSAANTNIMVLKGNVTTTEKTETEKSILNIKLYEKDGAYYFGTYEGLTYGTYTSAEKLVENTEYAIKVVADAVTGTYDLYVNEKLTIYQRRFKGAQEVEFTGIFLSAGTPEGNTDDSSVYYDNVIIRQATEQDTYTETEQEGYLLFEDFNDGVIADWKPTAIKGATAGTIQSTESGQELEIHLTGAGSAATLEKQFTPTDGTLVYETTYQFGRGGNTFDNNIMVIKGIEEGTDEIASLLNIKVYDRYFGVYDENTNSTTYTSIVASEDEKSYSVKVVVSADTDTYDVYIDGKLTVYQRALRAKANKFMGVSLTAEIPASATYSGTEAVITYDNLSVRIGTESDKFTDTVEEGYLLYENFADGVVADWKLAAKNGAVAATNAGENGTGLTMTLQKECEAGKESNVSIAKDLKTPASGQVSFSSQIKVSGSGLSGNSNVMLIKGVAEDGTGRTLTTIKLSTGTDGNYVFAAYDGKGSYTNDAQLNKTNVVCKENTEYTLTVVVDTDLDAYDLYVAEGAGTAVKIIEGGKLRYKAAKLTGMECYFIINQGASENVVVTLDALNAKAVTRAEEEVPADAIYYENFSDIASVNLPTGTAVSSVTLDRKLKIDVSGSQSASLTKTFESAIEGVVSYKTDFALRSNGADLGWGTVNIMWITGTGTNSSNMLGIKLISRKVDDSYVYNLGAFDGTNTPYISDVNIVADKTYSIEVIVNSLTDTYTLSVASEDMETPKTLTGSMSRNPSNFTGFTLNPAGVNANVNAQFYYDNICVKELPLLEEDFSASALDTGWGISGDATTLLNDGKLSVTLGNNSKSLTKSFGEIAGTVTYELDFILNKNSTVLGNGDTTIIWIKGTKEDGTKNANLLGIKVYENNGKYTFGAYNDNYNNSSLEIEDNVTYTLKIVVDSTEDIFKLYAKTDTLAEQMILTGQLTRKPSAFSGFCLEPKGKEGTNAIVYYDNISVKKGDTSNAAVTVNEAALMSLDEDLSEPKETPEEQLDSTVSGNNL